MIYVIAQFLLLIILIWPTSNLQFSLPALLLIIISGLIALFALLANPPGNFNVRPMPKQGGKLITSGIYRHVRHPMYSSLFFAGLGLVLCQFSYWKLLAWICLVLTLMLKARLEERALLQHYCEYERYQKTSKAFIPLLW